MMLTSDRCRYATPFALRMKQGSSCGLVDRWACLFPSDYDAEL